jgi:four helix bundle protein
MKFDEVENLRIYQQAEEIADQIWALTSQWGAFARDTVGKQLTKSADSIGANIAEGYGRIHLKENVQFLYIARGSLIATKFWLKRALARQLISQDGHQDLLRQLDNLVPQLNAFISGKRKHDRHRSTNTPSAQVTQLPGHLAT